MKTSQLIALALILSTWIDYPKGVWFHLGKWSRKII
jgi:hypothetical protein